MLAIVILNYNGAAMLERYLPLVTAHSPHADIIVADNASSDDSLDMLRREFPSVRIITFDRNWGFAGGYNHAFDILREEGKYDDYLLLNSDVEVTPHWLVPLREYMDAHPEVAACQPKIRSARRRGDFEYAGACGGFIDFYGYPFCRGRVMGMVEKDEKQYEDVIPVMWATGACLYIRAKDWHEVGGLDAGFFAHQEEIDLCWRLRSRGRGVVCVPQSMIYHVGGGTLPKNNPKKTMLNFRNNLLMLYKNLPEEDLRKVMKVRRYLDALAALKELLTGHFKDYQAIRRARKEFKQKMKTYEAIRKENLAKQVVKVIPERKNFSLLIHYYIFQNHKFSQLP